MTKRIKRACRKSSVLLFNKGPGVSIYNYFIVLSENICLLLEKSVL
nr:MAG TPA: hypothetical protein [Caudoviricetes sp.]